METSWIILLISVMGPMVGSLIGVLKKPTDKFMYEMLSFAAGVMLAISFLELIPEGINLAGAWLTMLGVAVGAVVMFAIDRMLPHIHPELCTQEQGCNLKKTSVYLLAGISLHNLPEGMAMAIGSVTEMKTGLAIAMAIAIHDIPEGICTAAPFYHATQKRWLSFFVSAATAVPVVVGYFLATFLYQVISLPAVGVIVAATAGLMIYICGDELIPTSSCKLVGHSTIFYLVAGVIFVIFLGMI